jgi:hypothetical protein
MVQTIISEIEGYVPWQPLETIKHNPQTDILFECIDSNTIMTNSIG